MECDGGLSAAHLTQPTDRALHANVKQRYNALTVGNQQRAKISIFKD